MHKIQQKENTIKNIVKAKFEPFNNKGFVVEEQKSNNLRIEKLLQQALKNNNELKKYPDFIVSSKEYPCFLLIAECSATTQQNASIDVALLHSSYLVREFDVISLNITSDSADNLLVSAHLLLKNYQKRILGKKLLTPLEYTKKYINDKETRLQKYEELLEYNKKLNEKLHRYKIPESQRSLLLSGILIALKDKNFKDSFPRYANFQKLADALKVAIKNRLQNAGIHPKKMDTLQNFYSFIKTNATLSKDVFLFINLINEINKKINSFVKHYKFYDIFGEFYIEFLRYANSDKGLGIVLTPHHITKLFCDLANLNQDSVVFDNCCGTGVFLISSMRRMLKIVNGDKEKEKKIKERQIVGIEYQDNIFLLACSNMIINGDEHINIFNDDCFNKSFKVGEETKPLVQHIREIFKPTVGFLNPPYKVGKTGEDEFSFLLNNLDGLSAHATCIALIPISCVLAQSGKKLQWKEKILKNHTLKAVLSLPDELFYNSQVAAVTIAIVIKAHSPHPPDYKTYFGYWKDDGFIKIKNKGRVDGGLWKDKRKKWVDSYRHKDSIAGLSVLQSVTAKDEWVAEAHLETDYSTLTKKDFIKNIKNFLSFQFLQYNNDIKNPTEISSKSTFDKKIKLNEKEWKWFKYADIFEIKKGYYNKKPPKYQNGEIIFIGSSEYNNGMTSQHTREDIEKNSKSGGPNNHPINHKIFFNCITISNDGSVGYAFYHPYAFTCSHSVTPIFIKNKMMNPYIAMFLCTIIGLERFKWAYGRKWRPSRMPHSTIKLPVNNHDDKNPDWSFIEDYIKSLPYSHNLKKNTKIIGT